MRLRKAVAKALMYERVCRVATVGRDGMPHVVPVCQVLVDGNVCFGTGSDSRKARNLQANPHIAVLVDLYAEDWGSLKGIMVQGTAKLIQRGPRFRKIRTLLYRKYPQYSDESGLEESEDVIVEMTPAHVVSWGNEG